MNQEKPAFPIQYSDGEHVRVWLGITARDYIAIQAMQGLLASQPMDYGTIAKQSYEYADALIAESNK